jgi:NMD protein affecting ribosome stability and mRNA decay
MRNEAMIEQMSKLRSRCRLLQSQLQLLSRSVEDVDGRAEIAAALVDARVELTLLWRAQLCHECNREFDVLFTTIPVCAECEKSVGEWTEWL